MQLQLLQETPTISIFYDSSNDWLFIDWRGDLTLAVVQANCLVIAQCFLERPYPRILNSNSGVTSMAAPVPLWLAREFLPHLRLAGIEYLAWVYAPSLPLKRLTDEAVRKLDAPVVNTFDDLELAFAWLQHTRFHYLDNPADLPSTAERQAELSSKVTQLADEINYYRHIVRCLSTQKRG